MTIVNFREQAKGRWRSILPQLGVPTKYLVNKQGPCPACGGKDRFRFDDKDGCGTYYCNQCGAGDGASLLMIAHGWTFRHAADEVRKIIPMSEALPVKPSLDTEKRLTMLRELWASGARITERDEAGRYLASRGLQGLSKALRFVDACPITGEVAPYMPAMIALVRDGKGHPASIHRTYLQNGDKAKIASPRKMMAGELPDSIRIELSQPAPVMGVAEGIETALAVTRDFGIPCWSAISAQGLERFEPHPDVTTLRIFGDNDPKFRGQASSYILAHRLATRQNPIVVTVEIPSAIGTDWADAPKHSEAA